LTALGILGLVFGCGGPSGPPRPQTVPASGMVMLDSKAVEGAEVALIPTKEDGFPARGRTDAAGKFTLSSFGQADGAVPGEYRVTVTLTKSTGPAPDPLAPGTFKGNPYEAATKAVEWVVPQKYSAADKSGLTATVKAGMEPLKFDLISK
jgi:hypothetical protein